MYIYKFIYSLSKYINRYLINRPLFPITKLSKIEFFSILYDKKKYIYIFFFRIEILSFPINKIFRNFLLLHFPFKTPSLAVFLHSQTFFSLMSRKIKILFKDLYKDRELCLPFFFKTPSQNLLLHTLLLPSL